MRERWINLNGEFDYAVTDGGVAFPSVYDGKITVPFAIESCLSGVKRTLKPGEALWYKKIFTLPENYLEKRVFINFEAVDWKCKVFINRKLAGEHTGGYSSFSFDVTDLLNDGENELIVYVLDPSDKGTQPKGKQTLKSHGIWYTATSGIWQTVWLEAVSENHIKKIKITPDIDKDVLNLKTCVEGENDSLYLKILDGDRILFDGKISRDENIPLSDYELWSPENPKLYDIILTLKNGEKTEDEIKSYFGMRKFSLGVGKDGYTRIFLNNKPYFQIGVLDQGYWSDGGMTPPSDEAMIYDIKKIKELGFNMIRKHIKTESARWYYYCDKLGMLVWQDMISGGKPVNLIVVGAIPNVEGVFTPIANLSMKDDKHKLLGSESADFREEFKKELMEMIDERYNCVSVCTYVIFNEGWGQFDALEISKTVKKADPTRLIDHASGWYDQGGGDFRSIHKYILPVTAPKMESQRAFVLSEFGGYSMIVKDHVYDEKKSFGYLMFKTKEDLTGAYVKLFKKQILPLVNKGLSAAVYTQLSDVEYEVNGIMTYDRKVVKIDEDAVKFINKALTENN